MRSLSRELIETVILALLLFLALQFSLQNFRVEGPSMIPTLRGGQYVLVSKLIYWHFQFQNADRILPFVKVTSDGVTYPFHPPNRGDVIVFHSPTDLSRDFVKRVRALDLDGLQEVLGPYLRNKELRGILKRKPLLLAEIDEMIQEGGELSALY